jgi:hypothetical protein
MLRTTRLAARVINKNMIKQSTRQFSQNAAQNATQVTTSSNSVSLDKVGELYNISWGVHAIGGATVGAIYGATNSEKLNDIPFHVGLGIASGFVSGLVIGAFVPIFYPVTGIAYLVKSASENKSKR